MSGLASFVEGFTGGVNQRQAWDDRKRSIKLEDEDRKWLAENRDWARGDRAYTVEERQRLRAEQDRLLAEQQAERDADAAAWAVIHGAGEGQSLPGAGEPPPVGGANLTFGPGVPSMPDPTQAPLQLPRSLPGSAPVASVGPAGGPIPQQAAGAAPVAPQTQMPVGPAGGPVPQTQRNWTAAPLTVNEWNTMTPEQRKAVPPAELSRAITAVGTDREASRANLEQLQAAQTSRQFTADMAEEDAQKRASNGLEPRSLPGVGAAPTPQPGAPGIAEPSAPGQPAVAPSAAPQVSMEDITGRPGPIPAPPPEGKPNYPARAVLGFNNPASQTPAQADRAVKSTMQNYLEVDVPRLVDHYLKTGDVAKAEAMTAWAADAKSQESMQLWAKGLHAYTIGDETGMLDNFAKYYNSLGLGVTVDRKASRMTRDKDGNVTGVEVTFTDQSGKTQTQHFDGTGDLLQMGIMGMQPDKMFGIIYDQQQAAQAARAKAQALEVSVQIAAMKLQQSGIKSDPARIAAIGQALMDNAVINHFDQKSPEEQGEMIASAMQGEDYALTLREGAATGAAGGGDAMPPVLYAPGP